MICFRMDPSRGLRVAEFSGRIDTDELLRSYANLIASADFDPTVDDLVDLEAVQALDVGGDSIRRLVSLFIPLDGKWAPTRLAIVAPTDELFGMARMYQILRTDAPGQVEVFRTRQEALQWLGAPA